MNYSFPTSIPSVFKLNPTKNTFKKKKTDKNSVVKDYSITASDDKKHETKPKPAY